MIRQHEVINGLLEPVIHGLGYELWGIEVLTPAAGTTLRVYIDRCDSNRIDVDDCEKVSRQIVGVLDVEDPIKGHYTLEVSSPGMDRLLFTESQFRRYQGEMIKVRTTAKIDGRRRFQGKLVAVSGSSIEIEDEQQRYELPFPDIERARVVPAF